MEFIQECAEDEDEELEESGISRPSLIYDPENNVLLNTERLIYEDGAWVPVLHVYKPDQIWYKYIVIIAAIATALKNNGFNCTYGYLADSKTNELGEKVELFEEDFQNYLGFIPMIREILSGNSPEKIIPTKCKRCAFYESCPQKFTVGAVKKVDDRLMRVLMREDNNNFTE
jgi:CRISPR/Cas system-associated exonuclease Cas4 (RecB family)